MVEVIRFPPTIKANKKPVIDIRNPKTLAKIYADCRRRNAPYPLAVFDGVDTEGKRTGERE